MKKISLTFFLALFICSVIFANEWVNFSDQGEGTTEYNLIHSTSSSVEFEVDIPGMYSRDIDDYQRVWIKEHTNMDSVGNPEVPVVSFLVAIPECNNIT